jgi:hypothetical protein
MMDMMAALPGFKAAMEVHEYRYEMAGPYAYRR